MQIGIIPIYDDDSRKHLQGPDARRKAVRTFGYKSVSGRQGLALYSDMAAGEKQSYDCDFKRL